MTLPMLCYISMNFTFGLSIIGLMYVYCRLKLSRLSSALTIYEQEEMHKSMKIKASCFDPYLLPLAVRVFFFASCRILLVSCNTICLLPPHNVEHGITTTLRPKNAPSLENILMTQSFK